jgi:hypothetical protein
MRCLYLAFEVFMKILTGQECCNADPPARTALGRGLRVIDREQADSQRALAGMSTAARGNQTAATTETTCSFLP